MKFDGKEWILVEQEVRPAHTPGIDWGAVALVLVRYGDRCLVWQKGCMYWSGGRDYAEAHLEVCEPLTQVCGKEVFRGGRLSQKMLRTHMVRIRELMDLPDLEALFIDKRKTLVVTKKG